MIDGRLSKAVSVGLNANNLMFSDYSLGAPPALSQCQAIRYTPAQGRGVAAILSPGIVVRKSVVNNRDVGRGRGGRTVQVALSE